MSNERERLLIELEQLSQKWLKVDESEGKELIELHKRLTARRDREEGETISPEDFVLNVYTFLATQPADQEMKIDESLGQSIFTVGGGLLKGDTFLRQLVIPLKEDRKDPRYSNIIIKIDEGIFFRRIGSYNKMIRGLFRQDPMRTVDYIRNSSVGDLIEDNRTVGKTTVECAKASFGPVHR